MKGNAAVLRKPGAELSIEEVEFGELAPDEVLVRIAGVGVCHTDLTAQSGGVPLPLPVVLGHEGAGVVHAVGGAVETLSVGDHVVLSFDSCRECATCTAGHPAYCEMFAALNYFGTRLDGTATMSRGDEDVHGSWFGQSSFGAYAVASVRNAVKVDDGVPLDILGPLGCGLMTGAGTVFNVLRPAPGQSLGVFGLGAVGLSAVMAAKAAGCTTIVAVDLNPERLKLATELGATHVIDPSQTKDVNWAITEISGTGLDFTVDAVGLGSVVRQAVEALRSPGVCATLGLQGLENEMTIDQGHLLIGRTLTGVIEGDADPHELIPRLIELWREGDFPFDRLVERRPFDEINEAIASARSGQVIKPVLVFDPA